MKLSFINNTNGQYSSDKIYFAIIGKLPSGQFCHNKAYGFPFDDVCEQSTLIEDPNPDELKVTISWD